MSKYKKAGLFVYNTFIKGPIKTWYTWNVYPF